MLKCIMKKETIQLSKTTNHRNKRTVKFKDGQRIKNENIIILNNKKEQNPLQFFFKRQYLKTTEKYKRQYQGNRHKLL